MGIFESKYEKLSSFGTLLYIVVALFVFVLIRRFLVRIIGKNAIHVKFASSFKGPATIPIFGNILQIMAARTEAPTKLMYEWRQKYGSIYRLWLGNNLTVVVSDVDYLKDIFKSKNVMFHGPNVDAFWNFLMDRGHLQKDIWKVGRKVQPNFSLGVMKPLLPKINERIDQLTENIREKIGREFDVQDIIFDFITDIFTITQCDCVMDSSLKESFDYRDTIGKVLQIINVAILFPGMGNKFAKYLIDEVFLGRLKKNYDTFIRLMTNDKLTSIRNDAEKSINLEKHKSSYLWTLSQKVRSYSNSDTEKENSSSTSNPIQVSRGIYFAAVENTYTAISFALVMIAMHDTVQDKLYEELYKIFGDDKRLANYEDIERLTYMDKVISETMRKMTPVPILIRYVSEDTRIGPYIFPEGTQVMIDCNAVHTDANFYSKPFEFNPDNFNEEIIAKRPPYSYLAFSAGGRSCGGQMWALTEIKLALTAILRKFIVRTSLKMADIKYTTKLATKTVDGYPIMFLSRE